MVSTTCSKCWSCKIRDPAYSTGCSRSITTSITGVHVLVCVREQPSLPIAPLLEVTVGVLHASVAVAVPRAPLISPEDGLHPSDAPLATVPPVVNVGAVRSEIQLIVLDAVEVLPQASIALNVLVCEREQPSLVTLPSLEVTVGLLHASVAVAVPRAPLIAPEDGLHPSDAPLATVPPVVSVGAVRSEIQLIVLDAVEVLPQASIALNVLVCEREQPSLVTLPSLEVTVGLLHASVAVAVPKAPLIAPEDGLHPSDAPLATVPPVVNVGAVRSEIQLIVLDAVEVLPQASIALNVLVCEREQPSLVTLPSLEVTVGLLHASVAVAVPKAPLIAPEDGLHPSDVPLATVPPVVNVGAVRSEIQLIVLDAVEVLPQASIALNVLVCEREQPSLVTLPSLEVTVGLLHASVAVAVPKAPLIAPEDGLHPSDAPLATVPPVVNVGAVRSEIQLIVLDAVEVLPQASIALNVLVCEREQPSLVTLPSLEVTVGLLHASVAVAVPKAPLIAPEDGLHPSDAPLATVPPVVNVGAVRSEIQLIVLDAVEVLPQASIALNVLVCEREQPSLVTLPSLEVTVGLLHASVAVAVPKAPLIAPEDGLHPSDAPLATVPPVVNVGAVRSEIQLIVLDAVEVLPQASIALNVLVCEREQPSLVTLPSLEVTVGLLHASVAVAVPKAPSIVPEDGLHPSDAPLATVPPVVNVGAVRSEIQLIVLDAVEVLPQASIALNVLVCEREQPSLVTLPSLEVTVGLLHASVAVAVPKAPLIAPEDGLHPSDAPLATVPPVVNVGGVRSEIQVTVRDAVEVLPQASIALNVLVCEREQPSLVTLPSLEVTVGLLHASVAVAVPKAPLIAPEDGLHPSDAPLATVPPVVNVGAVRSEIQLIVLDAVEVLPQASIALNVLVCEREQPSLVTLPSLEVTVGLLHASVAVAVPKAPLIAPEDGLHPSDAPLATVPPVVNVGAVRSEIQLIVLDAVEVLPQASIALNVLVCEREQPSLVTLPSLEVTVGLLHASVAVAVPKAPLIAPEDGLHPSDAPLATVPPVVNVGAVRSEIQLIVLDAVEVLPQASIALNVLVCEREQPSLVTLPSLEVTVGLLHASVAVAVPKAPLIAPEDGLHPSDAPLATVPPVVNVGAVRSEIQLIVLDAVEVLPQASIALNVLVCEREQPSLVNIPLLEVTVGLLHASVAVAVPRAPLISPEDGLHPSDAPLATVPPVVNVGAVRSEIQLIVLDAVEVLPQASIALNVLVCEREQPSLVTLPSLEVTVGLLHASVAVAVPKAPSIVPEDGLHPSDAPLATVPPVVNVGAVRSEIQLIVLDAVEVLPQASIALNVLVCEREQPSLVTLPSLEVTVGLLHASVAVAVPKAPLIAPEDGLHPSDVPLATVPPVVNVGGVRSEIQLIVLDAVEVLPQASIALNVLVCEREQPSLVTLPSLEVTVGLLHASVAVAVPRAPLIVPEDGLHPSDVPLATVPPVVNVGAVRSEIQLIVRDAVEVLPQASMALNVLVCEREQPSLANYHHLK